MAIFKTSAGKLSLSTGLPVWIFILLILVFSFFFTKSCTKNQKYKAENDSLVTLNRSYLGVIDSFQAVAMRTLVTANWYKQRSESLDSSDRAKTKLLTLEQKKNAILKKYKDNYSISPAVAESNPQLTDEPVVEATLNTINENERNKTALVEARNGLTQVQIQNEELVKDYNNSRLQVAQSINGVQLTANKARQFAKGGVPILRHRRLKELRAVAAYGDSIANVLLTKELAKTLPK